MITDDLRAVFLPGIDPSGRLIQVAGQLQCQNCRELHRNPEDGFVNTWTLVQVRALVAMKASLVCSQCGKRGIREMSYVSVKIATVERINAHIRDDLARQDPITVHDTQGHALHQEIMAEVMRISDGHPSTSGWAGALSAAIVEEMRKVTSPTVIALSAAIDRVAARAIAARPSRAKEDVAPDVADPLDVAYDGVSLRDLLDADLRRRSAEPDGDWTGDRRRITITSAQRAALSACWSAQLRARVDHARDLERRQVKVDDQDDLVDLMAPDVKIACLSGAGS